MVPVITALPRVYGMIHPRLQVSEDVLSLRTVYTDYLGIGLSVLPSYLLCERIRCMPVRSRRCHGYARPL